MDEYSFNDWRAYLEHSWGNSVKNKLDEHNYNQKYYKSHREEILARAKARYARLGKLRGFGNNSGAGGGDSSSESSKKSGGSSKKASSSSKAAELTSSKIELDKDAPEWLKNYAAEIEKVRKATGNPNWVPAHVNDFGAWQAELKKNYPDLNMTEAAAKEVWNTINSKFGGSSSSSSSSDAGKSSSTKKDTDKGEVTKTNTNVTDKTDRKEEKSTSSETRVTQEHRLEDLEERAREADKDKEAIQKEIEEEKKRRRNSSRRETK